MVLALVTGLAVTGCGQIVRQAASGIIAQATTGPSVPPESPAGRAACRAARGSFARDDNWDRPRPAWQLYECDNVPYIGSDGSLYLLNLRYGPHRQLIAPRGVIGNVTRRECREARYPQADVNPGPGRWDARIHLCSPTTAQLRTMGG